MGGHSKFESGAGLNTGSRQIGHFLYSSLKVEERQVKISYPTFNPRGGGVDDCFSCYKKFKASGPAPAPPPR